MKRKQYSSALKAKIVIEALRETKTITELAAQHQIHPNLITKWKQAAIQDLPSLFERGTATDEKEQAQEKAIAGLYQEIGKLTTQLTWLKKKSGLEPESL
jgi:putative transposase